ncbi:MAG TPA: hypothetical protein P5341_15210, partial [Hyphomonas sp.]|nr:hypothetical protein [Hyphomonas sp.]
MLLKSRCLTTVSIAGLALLSACGKPAPANVTRSALSDEGMAMLDTLVLAPASADEFTTRCDTSLALIERMLTDLETRDTPAGKGDLLDYDAMLNVAYSVGYGEAPVIAEANPDAAIRETGDLCQQKTSDMATRISLSRPVYDRLSSIDATKLDARSAYLLDRTLREYRRAGIDKDEATREKVRSLTAEMAELSTGFSKNLREIQGTLKVSPSDLAGLPDDYISAHPPGDDGLATITTDYPDLFPI